MSICLTFWQFYFYFYYPISDNFFYFFTDKMSVLYPVFYRLKTSKCNTVFEAQPQVPDVTSILRVTSIPASFPSIPPRDPDPSKPRRIYISHPSRVLSPHKNRDLPFQTGPIVFSSYFQVGDLIRQGPLIPLTRVGPTSGPGLSKIKG